MNYKKILCRQANPLENDSVRLDDNSVLVGQQKAREKTLFLDDEGRTTTTPIPRLASIQLHHVQFSCCADCLIQKQESFESRWCRQYSVKRLCSGDCGQEPG